MKKTHTPIPLKDKNIVIFGGGGLVGAQCATDCVKTGATVIIADIDTKKGRALEHALNALQLGRVYYEGVNIGNERSLQRFAHRVQKRFKYVDGVIHAAYPRTKSYGQNIENARPQAILTDIAQQLGGPLLATRALLPLMKRGGSIVFLSSIYGVVAPRFEIYRGTTMTVPAEYAAVKGGIISLGRYLAAYLKKRGIYVNVISPGGIANNQPTRFVRAYSKYGRLLSPADVSRAVMRMLNTSTTGKNIIIDNGWTRNNHV